jgi:hypothetical protein
MTVIACNALYSLPRVLCGGEGNTVSRSNGIDKTSTNVERMFLCPRTIFLEHLDRPARNDTDQSHRNPLSVLCNFMRAICIKYIVLGVA